MLKTTIYEAQDGSKATAAYCDGGSAYVLAGKRERFAQLMARGKRGLDAYLEAFEILVTDEAMTEIAKEQARDCTRDLLHDTSVVLRIQELKRPVLRVLKRKVEYNLQKALEQCQVAYDIAYAQGDTKGILAAIKMQAELAKLLSTELNVNHRYGVLDDTSTEILLAMKKEIEVRQAKQKMLGSGGISEAVIVGQGAGAALVPSSGAPSVAVVD